MWASAPRDAAAQQPARPGAISPAAWRSASSAVSSPGETSAGATGPTRRTRFMTLRQPFRSQWDRIPCRVATRAKCCRPIHALTKAAQPPAPLVDARQDGRGGGALWHAGETSSRLCRTKCCNDVGRLPIGFLPTSGAERPALWRLRSRLLLRSPIAMSSTFGAVLTDFATPSAAQAEETPARRLPSDLLVCAPHRRPGRRRRLFSRAPSISRPATTSATGWAWPAGVMLLTLFSYPLRKYVRGMHRLGKVSGGSCCTSCSASAGRC